MIGRGEAKLLPDAWQIDDGTVSRRHALVRRETGEFYLEDAGSRNGTWLSGTVLRGEKARLANGALILLGGQVALFRRMTEEQIAAIEAEQERPLGPVATASPVLAVALRRLRILAGTDRPVLLAGETGTGKEVYARSVHDLERATRPLRRPQLREFQSRALREPPLWLQTGQPLASQRGPPRRSGERRRWDDIFRRNRGDGGRPADEAAAIPSGQDVPGPGLDAAQASGCEDHRRHASAAKQPAKRRSGKTGGRAGGLASPATAQRRPPGALPAFPSQGRARTRGCRGWNGMLALAFCLYTWPRNVRELEATLAEGALSAAERGAARIDLPDVPARLRQVLLRRGPRPGERFRPSSSPMHRLAAAAGPRAGSW